MLSPIYRKNRFFDQNRKPLRGARYGSGGVEKHAPAVPGNDFWPPTKHHRLGKKLSTFDFLVAPKVDRRRNLDPPRALVFFNQNFNEISGLRFPFQRSLGNPPTARNRIRSQLKHAFEHPQLIGFDSQQILDFRKIDFFNFSNIFRL